MTTGCAPLLAPEVSRGHRARDHWIDGYGLAVEIRYRDIKRRVRPRNDMVAGRFNRP